MKKSLLLAISLLFAGSISARQLTSDEALACAMSKLQGSSSLRARTLASGVSASRVALAHTALSEANAPLYYIYNVSDGGFIIASADSRSESLLGYTDNNDFEASKQNHAFMAWLSECERALLWLSNQPENAAESEDTSTRSYGATSVAPLLGDIKWGQNRPYNNNTPMAGTAHTPTGCVATAMAQIMMYYKWPETGKGKHTNENEPSQTVDFSNSTYDWATLKPNYSMMDKSESAKAVAKLMYEIGCSVDMSYNVGGSGASTYLIMSAMTEYFRYDKGMTMCSRDMYSSAEWNEILQTELNNARPILFSAATAAEEGHAFVLDGYNEQGMYHVNWGWDGNSDGYYEINLLNPHEVGTGGSEGGYSYYQMAITKIAKDETGKSEGKPELEVSSPIFYDEDKKQFSFSFFNIGLGDFSRLFGLMMLDTEGNYVPVLEYDQASMPIKYMHGATISADVPVEAKAGCKVFPFYRISQEDTPILMNTPVSAPKSMIAYNDGSILKWKYQEDEMPRLSNKVTVLRNYVSYAPKVKVSLTNAASATYEYNDTIAVYITKMEAGKRVYYCRGRAQAFVAPGETIDYDIICDMPGVGKKYTSIEAGEYEVILNVSSRGIVESSIAATLTMVANENPIIECDNFTLDKSVVTQGQELTGSFVVHNTGGFGVETFAMAIFAEGQETSSNAVTVTVEIEPNSESTVNIIKLITENPGKYRVGFYHLVDGNYVPFETSARDFTIEGTSAIGEVTTPVGNKPLVTYDINGRSATQLQKGRLYIGNGKFIIR